MGVHHPPPMIKIFIGTLTICLILLLIILHTTIIQALITKDKYFQYLLSLANLTLDGVIKNTGSSIDCITRLPFCDLLTFGKYLS